jgi:probable F420-dependent oxidoreductase
MTTRDDLRVGIALPQFGPLCDATRVGEFATAAEGLGYRSFWVGDRVLTPTHPSTLYPGGGTEEDPYPPEFTAALDPFILLAVAATATRSAALGSSTINAPWTSPIMLSRLLTSIDVLSRGRLEVGFGLGWLPEEYTATGTAWPRRGALLDEALDVLETIWTNNPFEHKGAAFTIPEAVADLRPVREGGPPVLLGGFSVAALTRVGNRADGWLTGHGLPPDYEEHLWSIARGAAEAAGRDPNALHMETRINLPSAATVDDAVRSLDQAAAKGSDGAFLDLHFCTRDVDDALDLASAIADRM